MHYSSTRVVLALCKRVDDHERDLLRCKNERGSQPSRASTHNYNVNALWERHGDSAERLAAEQRCGFIRVEVADA